MQEHRRREQAGKFAMTHDELLDDFKRSILVAFAEIRERVKNGGPTWVPRPCQCPACCDRIDQAFNRN